MNDPTEPNGGDTEPNDETESEANGGTEPVVPAPLRDETTVELVRGAIGVARGELSDERFAEKYGAVADEERGK